MIGTGFNAGFGLPPVITGGGGPLGFLDLSQFGYEDQPPARVIDPDQTNLIPEVVVYEDGDDELIITQHPVEQGALINDHAYKRPAQLRVRAGWSDAYGGYTGAGADIYAQVLALQAERRPFTVLTGKRMYQNMLVSALRTHTDSGTEFAFVADILFQEILFAQVQQISQVNSDPNAQANPSVTQPPVNSGSVSTSPASLSSGQIQNLGGTATPSTSLP